MILKVFTHYCEGHRFHWPWRAAYKAKKSTEKLVPLSSPLTNDNKGLTMSKRIRISRIPCLASTTTLCLLLLSLIVVMVQSLPSTRQSQHHSRIILTSTPSTTTTNPSGTVTTLTASIPRKVSMHSLSPTRTTTEASDVLVTPSTNEVTASRGTNAAASALFADATSTLAPTAATKNVSWSHSQIQQSMVLLFMSLSGIVEAICWFQYKCFPNMITGHTVKVLDAIARWQWKDAGWGTAMILSYVLGGTLYKTIHLLQERRQPQQQPQEQQQQQQHASIHVIPNTLTAVARWVAVWFSLSDFVAIHLLSGDHANILWRLPLLSVGFGMINAAISDIWGTVTNAVTGHWTKIGTGFAEGMLLGPKSIGQASKMSVACMVVFIMSLITTSGLLQGLAGVIGSTTTSSSSSSSGRVLRSILFHRIPPLGTTLGLVYGAVFTGYARYYQRYATLQQGGKGQQQGRR